MKLAGTAAIAALIFSATASATIIFGSGEGGTVGSTDPNVKFLDSGFTSTDFSAAFTAGNFTSAASGTAAHIIAGYGCPGTWICSLPDGPGAQWINTTGNNNTGDTALFSVAFTVPVSLSSSSLTLYYAVDNQLGGNNAGIYVDGTALPSSTGIGGFSSEQTYTDSTLGALSAGTHYLYIDGVNLGGPGGLIFYGLINGTAAVPEPKSGWLILAGLGALVLLYHRRRGGMRPVEVSTIRRAYSLQCRILHMFNLFNFR